ncbi:MAG: hypothetical protein M3Y28_06025 [Armatimonadota bacterium]|nr:hypothetical protein [Armatimonadota bacterium]
MSFQTDATLAENVGTSYGDYMSTFESEHRQVRADLFKQGSWLVAHVSFPTGLDVESVTDAYLSTLQSYAKEHGFERKYRLLFS